MKIAGTLILAVLLTSCATFSRALTPGAAERDTLWRQGHAAMAEDSFRVAIAAFQRLTAEHPRTMQGREARFYMATLYLDPENPSFSAERAAEHLQVYIATDTAGGRMLRRPEAEVLVGLARELAIPCERRESPLRCDPVEIVRRVTVPVEGEPQPPQVAAAAEIARLQRQVSERDATIRQLRAELARVRETLAPRP